MLTLLELALELAAHWCSWRLWLCLILAIGLIVGLYFKFPEQSGFWPLSGFVGAIIIGFGIVSEWRANR
jgi:hypothetical protein